jgi:hypothetical protein
MSEPIISNNKPYTDNATIELEHDNFIKGVTGLPTKLVTRAGTDYPIAYLEETRGAVTYRGEVLKPEDLAETGASKWLISKTTRTGGLTKVEWASQKYDSTWEFRHTSFPLSEPTDFLNGKAMIFDGISECVAFPERMFRDSTEKWSMSFWYKPRINSNQTIFSRINADSGSGRQISNKNGDLMIEVYTKNSLANLIIVSKPSVDYGLPMFTADKWHNVIIAIGGGSSTSDLMVIVDGIDWSTNFDIISDSVSGTNMGGGTPSIAYFGKSIMNPTWFLDGILDEVVLSDSRFNIDEAYWLWNNGIPNDVWYLTQTSGLDVRYWFRMGDGEGDYFPYCTASICNDSTETPSYSLRGAMRNMTQDNYTEEHTV